MFPSANLFMASLLCTSVLAASRPPLPKANSSGASNAIVAATYFAGYHIKEGFTVDKIPWTKYSEVKYAFAETTANGSVDLSKSSPESLPAFVSAAKKNNVKALVSVGGWTGSKYFSTSVGSPENRTAFVKIITKLVEDHQLDGADFDFEYPNNQGLGCNAISPNDTANFLAFLQELRASPAGAKLYLTAATSLIPWKDATGAASTDLAGFAAALDYLMVMNYDVFGAWAPTAGPNAPLRSACEDATRNAQGSAEAGVAKWIAAGVPAGKLVLGVPAYGHGFRVEAAAALPKGSAGALAMYPAQNSSSRFKGSSWDSDPPVDECGKAQPPSGTYQFRSMITEMGFLTEKGEPAANVTAGFDECSATPAIYDEARKIFVSYDNAKSMGLKGQWIKEQGLKGFALWETGGDYNNILVDSVRKAVGLA